MSFGTGRKPVWTGEERPRDARPDADAEADGGDEGEGEHGGGDPDEDEEPLEGDEDEPGEDGGGKGKDKKKRDAEDDEHSDLEGMDSKAMAKEIKKLRQENATRRTKARKLADELAALREQYGSQGEDTEDEQDEPPARGKGQQAANQRKRRDSERERLAQQLEQERQTREALEEQVVERAVKEEILASLEPLKLKQGAGAAAVAAFPWGEIEYDEDSGEIQIPSEVLRKFRRKNPWFFDGAERGGRERPARLGREDDGDEVLWRSGRDEDEGFGEGLPGSRPSRGGPGETVTPELRRKAATYGISVDAMKRIELKRRQAARTRAGARS